MSLDDDLKNMISEKSLKNMSEADKLQAKEFGKTLKKILEMDIELNPSRYSEPKESRFGRRASVEVLEPFEGTPEEHQEHLIGEGWSSDINSAPLDTHVDAIWEEDGQLLTGCIHYYTARGSMMKFSEQQRGWQENPPTILQPTWDKPARMLKIKPLWWKPRVDN